MAEFEAKQTHCGQYKRYDDFYREWDITTEADTDSAVKWALENLVKRDIPDAATFRKEVAFGGDHFSDVGYYFKGYYSISKIEGGYHFKVCEPYAD